MIRNILLVGNDLQICDFLVRRLTADKVHVARAPSVRSAASMLRDAGSAKQVLLLVISMSQSDEDLLAALSRQHAQLPIFVVVPEQSRPEALRWLQNCQQVKVVSVAPEDPTTWPSIIHAVAEGLLDTSGGQEPQQGLGTDRELAADPRYGEEFLRRVGLSDVPVLLHGETGVGKEVMARRLWAYSNRVGKPFLKLNCAALPSELIESELFGYEKGAFTGAIMDKPGKFELAQGGTILLDEIGDMDTRLQAKLLQVLQDGEVQPLGSSRTIKVNVRIMAATHRDLRAAIALGSFREDLYYRLNVINITIPPLRERRHEIITLAQQLLLRHAVPGSPSATIPETLRRALLEHRWPGNVRELENVMRRYLVYQDAALLVAELIDPSESPKPRLAVPKAPMSVHAVQNSHRVSFDHFTESSRIAESKLLLETLEAVRWNRRQAAARLNIDYKALLYKLQKHGIVDSKAKRREVSA